eukprot:CAMPEP_0174372806 /NCGR_PEP_ID=MMETSP0811_2-20130205/104785_1 /TAXON_ID=73025 ORGANISM="Eutreptiella gymnastica-like, Strain CCMP1594" /NCGR_SAMPLE_ID=MMETSP0811_2 /ASSEMBLY_ACC=CAM_ASM_000667 /LENGTH=143 /DNA_ID=CAMNT_0015520519 /DNA_START=165 /DNA_END=596 /DNA_ORIENTATION=+
MELLKHKNQLGTLLCRLLCRISGSGIVPPAVSRHDHRWQPLPVGGPGDGKGYVASTLLGCPRLQGLQTATSLLPIRVHANSTRQSSLHACTTPSAAILILLDNDRVPDPFNAARGARSSLGICDESSELMVRREWNQELAWTL